jgi:hypothetical protein
MNHAGLLSIAKVLLITLTWLLYYLTSLSPRHSLGILVTETQLKHGSPILEHDAIHV